MTDLTMLAEPNACDNILLPATPLPFVSRHNSKPLFPILLRGQFQVFLLDDLWGISAFQGHSLASGRHSSLTLLTCSVTIFLDSVLAPFCGTFTPPPNETFLAISVECSSLK
ncbi:MAG: hypothetical protein JWM16_5375 [Verrucomicrobiales bacterium]|nr:hypothetical protein [Verrucomicrobiales bacterium]